MGGRKYKRACEGRMGEAWLEGSPLCLSSLLSSEGQHSQVCTTVPCFKPICPIVWASVLPGPRYNGRRENQQSDKDWVP